MNAIPTILVGFFVGALFIWFSQMHRGGGYRPYVPDGINPRPLPPGYPKPPECQYIMKGLRMPWSPYPLWLWSTYWKVSELPDTKWARKIKTNIAKNSASRKHRPF